MSKAFLKKLGIGLLLIPLAFFLTFAIGEVLSGDMSGLSHLLQATPLVILIVLASKKPLIGGVLLLILSLILGIWYALSNSSSFQTILLVEIFLFIPPFMSGAFLLLSSKRK